VPLTQSPSLTQLPSLVAHCDWGSQPGKRWIAVAHLVSGTYKAFAPQQVGEMKTLLHRLRNSVPVGSSILIGFDFPIGLPAAYAQLAKVRCFPEFLLNFCPTDNACAANRWSRFHEVCAKASEICLERPFYPLRPGGARRDAIHQALGLEHRNQLYRKCELRQHEQTNACSVFWTLGGNQVGKSALLGWRHLLAPARRAGALRLWPFDGPMTELIQPGTCVATETYPTEYHARLFGAPLRGKRYASKRVAVASEWLSRAESWNIALDSKLTEQIKTGFADRSTPPIPAEKRDNRDDAFDASVGLFGMLDSLLHFDTQLEPTDEAIRNIEGWIFGLDIRAAVSHK